MPVRLTLLIALCVVVLLSASAAGAATTAKRDAWATVNLCNTQKSPDWIGLRASMPGVSRKGTIMLMRFQVQYRTSAKTWKQVPKLDTHYLKVGTGRTGRVAGRSFKIQPPKQGSSFVLRGLVSFQWRTPGGTLLQAKKRMTVGGHAGTVGADPAGYSAATCTITG